VGGSGDRKSKGGERNQKRGEKKKLGPEGRREPVFPREEKRVKHGTREIQETIPCRQPGGVGDKGGPIQVLGIKKKASFWRRKKKETTKDEWGKGFL